jgi:hypothetical protein
MAMAVRIQGAIPLYRKTNGEPSTSTAPSEAAQLIAAGAVNVRSPATTPMSNAPR